MLASVGLSELLLGTRKLTADPETDFGILGIFEDLGGLGGLGFRGLGFGSLGGLGLRGFRV